MSANTNFNVHDRLEALIMRRERAREQRQAMRKRLRIKVGGFRDYFEEVGPLPIKQKNSKLKKTKQ